MPATAVATNRRIAQWLGRRCPTRNRGDAVRSAIHPIVVGDEAEAVELSRSLYAEGFLVPAIRYPTVAKGAARLRITVTAAHTEQQISRLAEAVNRLRPT